MKGTIFIILLFCVTSTIAISADNNLEFRTYYQNLNMLTTLLSAPEIDQLMKIKSDDSPIEHKLKKAGVTSDKRIKEIKTTFNYLLAHTKKDVNQDESTFLLLLGRLRSSFEMPIEVVNSRNGMKARIALYSEARGRKIDDIRSSVIKGFENGQMSTADVLKLIDFEDKGIMGSYIDEWIKNPDGTWYIVISSLLLLK